MSGTRCPSSKGTGTLRCCRVTEHDTTGQDDAGHCWHSTLLGPLAGPHEYFTRANAVHPLVCVIGRALDGA